MLLSERICLSHITSLISWWEQTQMLEEHDPSKLSTTERIAVIATSENQGASCGSFNFLVHKEERRFIPSVPKHMRRMYAQSLSIKEEFAPPFAQKRRIHSFPSLVMSAEQRHTSSVSSIAYHKQIRSLSQ